MSKLSTSDSQHVHDIDQYIFKVGVIILLLSFCVPSIIFILSQHVSLAFSFKLVCVTSNNSKLGKYKLFSKLVVCNYNYEGMFRSLDPDMMPATLTENEESEERDCMFSPTFIV